VLQSIKAKVLRNIWEELKIQKLYGMLPSLNLMEFEVWLSKSRGLGSGILGMTIRGFTILEFLK
jgi:hypothetical protein